MKKVLSMSLAAALMLAALFIGCQNLDVQNQNQPDEARALATPSDIESLIKSSFLGWFDGHMDAEPSMGLAVMSDAYTCGWGNFGMSVLSQEPRTEFTNTSSYGRANITENPWFNLYSAISSATDGIRNISDGTVTLGAADDKRALAFAKFVQGLSHGWLSLYFDQAFIFDENVDLNTFNPQDELKPYTEVNAAAIAMLEDAITQFNATAFTLPADWIRLRTYTSAELARIAHSYIARYMIDVARSPAERRFTDGYWATVLTHLDQGITEDFEVTGIGAGRHEPWWSAVHWYGRDWGTWLRADYHLIGPSDPTSGYADWAALSPSDRDEFIFPSSDLRVWDGTLDANGDQNSGLYFDQLGPTGFPGQAQRRSRYGHNRFTEYRFESDAGSPVPIYRTQEHDFIRAEALLHMGGSTAEIAALLDKYHVDNGGYTTTATLAVGSITDNPNPLHAQGATLWSVLKYEKRIELLGTSSGLEFFTNRAWGELSPRTLLHFPVPAKDLETLGFALYSHGGTRGDVAKRSSKPQLIPPQAY